MKSAALFSFLSLTTLALAAPSPSHIKRQSVTVPEETIINAINKWRSDIQVINGFLNTALGQGPLNEDPLRAQVGDAAGNTDFKNTAEDEMTQLVELMPILGIGDVDAQALLGELAGRKMESKLQNIQAEGTKPLEESVMFDRVKELSVSHCKVLFTLDTFWRNVRDTAKITEDRVSVEVPRPNIKEEIC